MCVTWLIICVSTRESQRERVRDRGKGREKSVTWHLDKSRRHASFVCVVRHIYICRVDEEREREREREREKARALARERERERERERMQNEIERKREKERERERRWKHERARAREIERKSEWEFKERKIESGKEREQARGRARKMCDMTYTCTYTQQHWFKCMRQAPFVCVFCPIHICMWHVSLLKMTQAQAQAQT